MLCAIKSIFMEWHLGNKLLTVRSASFAAVAAPASSLITTVSTLILKGGDLGEGGVSNLNKISE